MKELTITADSWHYRLARYGLLDDGCGDVDLCRYFWALVRGVLRTPFVIIVGSMLLYVLIVAPLMAIYAWLALGMFSLNEAAVAGFVLWAGVAIFALLLWLIEGNYRTPAPIRLAKAGYRGWKDRTCVLVKVTGRPEK